MYARNISFRVKSNMQSDYTRTFENQLLPLLRKQKGFRDEITLSNPGSQDAVSISLWEHKNNQEQCRRLQHQRLPRSVEDLGEGNRWNAQGSDV